MTKILSDDVVQNYTNEDAFLSRLKEVEANTQWVQRCLEDILIDRAAINATEAQSHTNNYGTKLMLCPRGLSFGNEDYIPLRQCSMMSLFQRMDEGGQILQRLDPEGVHDFVELGIKYSKEPKKIVKMPVVEGKINAFLSEGYVDTLPSPLVFEEFQKHLETISNSKGLKFSGAWSYPSVTGWYALPDKRVINNREYEIVVGLTTSDAGFSGININAFIRNDNVNCLPLITTMSVIHRGDTNFIKYQEQLNMISSVLDKGINHLNDLMSIKIDNPINTMKRAAKKCGLPKREVLEKLDNLAFNPSNAFDCYLVLARVLTKDENGNINERVQGDVMKLLGIDWEKIDLPGEFAW